MLGSFLELAIPTADVAAALAFYESLGFVQAPVGEAWPYAYAVVTDGRISLGLHGAGLEEPTLTFVAPGVRSRLAEFDALGLALERTRLDDVALHEAAFRDPDGHLVRLLEARTFSPPALEPTFESALGYFGGFAVASHDPATSGRFWESLGFVAFSGEDDGAAPGTVLASSRDLNLAFRTTSHAAPTLCFTSVDATRRVATLRDRGFDFAARLPSGSPHEAAALLRGPDGLHLLVVQAVA